MIPPDQALGAGEADERPPAILFLRRIIDGLGCESLMSVDSMSSSFLKSRAIVTHVIARKGSTWKCSKDPGLVSCFHINKARELYPEPVGEDLEAALEGTDEDSGSVAVDVSELGAFS